MCVFLKHTEEYFFWGGQDIFTVGTFYVLYCHNEMTLQLNEIKQQLHSGVASVMNLLCPFKVLLSRLVEHSLIHYFLLKNVLNLTEPDWAISTSLG